MAKTKAKKRRSAQTNGELTDLLTQKSQDIFDLPEPWNHTGTHQEIDPEGYIITTLSYQYNSTPITMEIKVYKDRAGTPKKVAQTVYRPAKHNGGRRPLCEAPTRYCKDKTVLNKDITEYLERHTPRIEEVAARTLPTHT
ncbi:hypothetical protein CMO92_01935 [Candidatus Woesearchaeota archaeon]|nr:hypothetical protein [Candidatus Woesearchaeota archaeon]|tara:strand:+ start:399 stop:818 length:420 start_codon:yes stop_codon:yes gene_type:complete